jgi:hypothetical protein
MYGIQSLILGSHQLNSWTIPRHKLLSRHSGNKMIDDEPSPDANGYRDEFTDDDDVFHHGDGDEDEDAIDMHRQHSK